MNDDSTPSAPAGFTLKGGGLASQPGRPLCTGPSGA